MELVAGICEYVLCGVTASESPERAGLRYPGGGGGDLK